MRLCLLLPALCVATVADAQTPVPTPKNCTGVSAVVWEQSATDVVESWQLVVAGTPRPTWPVGQCTPVPSPTGGTGAPAYSHSVSPMPSDSFWLLACNSDGCSDPSNAMQCVSPSPTVTATITVTPVPTRTRKPKPHPPHWLDWVW